MPHISEDEYLQLEYEVELSSFTGGGTNGVPPPRQENSVQSEVTIPDGFTIVVGGLRGTSFSETVNAVPILGPDPDHQVPVQQPPSATAPKRRFYVFIRPTILRDDRFEDLKYLSGGEPEGGRDCPTIVPHSEPLLMRAERRRRGGR